MSKSLTQLAQEVERQANTKRDFAVDSRRLRVDLTDTKRVNSVGKESHDTQIVLDGDEPMKFGMTELFHDQVATQLDIPKKYYEKMRDHSPNLLASNINHWLTRDHEPRLVRTLDGKARAYLSKRYHVIDNYDMLTAVLPPLKNRNMEFSSCEITERRLYLKVLFPDIQAAIKPGDIVRAGLVVSNSEVGAGMFKVEPFTLRLVCTNGMINESVFNRRHVGRGHEALGDEIREILTDTTKQLDDRVLLMKMQDVVKHSLTKETFEANVEKYREAAGNKITGDPERVLEVTQKRLGYGKGMGAGIMRHLIEGGDLSQWGLANAITAQANDVQDYDDATWLQRAGGKIIELTKHEWKEISTVAAHVDNRQKVLA